MCSKNCCSGGGRCLINWRGWIRPLVIVVYSVILLVVLPLLIMRLQESNAEPQDQAGFIGGIFVLLALPISFWEITQHLVHYTKPHLQKHIIRILWMVPIYALNAWFGLILPDYAIYMDTCRECYEAYVIYNFLMFLLNFLKECVDIEEHFGDRPPAKHLYPFCCLPACDMGSNFIENCKHGILQYTVVRPITTAIAFISEMNGVYGEGQFQWDVAYPYLIVINQLSQFVAMYCLVFFYKVHKTELAPMNPLSKFFCIKSVVFFSFFQGFVISILVYTGAISETFTTKDHKVQRMSSSLQNFLICVEMLLAAVGHMFAFSHKPYVNSVDCGDCQTHPNCWNSFKAMWDVSDVQQDVSDHIRAVAKFGSRSYETRQHFPTLRSFLTIDCNEHCLSRFHFRNKPKQSEDPHTLSPQNSQSCDCSQSPLEATANNEFSLDPLQSNIQEGCQPSHIQELPSKSTISTTNVEPTITPFTNNDFNNVKS